MSIDTSLLAGLPSLKLRAEAVVQGILSGIHKSSCQGQSVEFAEHKEYSPGDDLRHLDWKAFGKFDRYYVKRFEQETEQRAILAVDASGSMAYASGPMSKLEIASTLAAAVAWILIRQQDAVGLMVFGDGDVHFIPPGTGPSHLRQLLESLDSLSGKGRTSLSQMASCLAGRAKNRESIFVFSDFFDDAPDAAHPLLALHACRHELSLFHVLDTDELSFPFDTPSLFLPMEGPGESLAAHPRDLRDSYLKLMESFTEGLRRQALESGSSYVRVTNADSLDLVLRAFADQRNRSVRTSGRRT